MSAFGRRLTSAVVMIIIMALLFYLGKPALKPFTLVTMIALQYEAYHLLFLKNNTQLRLIRLVLFAAGTLMGPFIGFGNSLVLIAFFIVLLELLVLPVSKLTRVTNINQTFFEISKLFTFMLYALYIPSFIYLILTLDDGIFWFLLLLFTTLGSDTCAFVTGKNYGKTLIAPLISPNKTLEGSIGGLFGATLLSIPFALSKPEYSLLTVIFTGTIAGLLGQIGDLFESLLKRTADVKDSGTLIPGHGGLLDRIDGIIFASPWIYLVGSWLS